MTCSKKVSSVLTRLIQPVRVIKRTEKKQKNAKYMLFNSIDRDCNSLISFFGAPPWMSQSCASASGCEHCSATCFAGVVCATRCSDVLPCYPNRYKRTFRIRHVTKELIHLYRLRIKSSQNSVRCPTRARFHISPNDLFVIRHQVYCGGDAINEYNAGFVF